MLFCVKFINKAEQLISTKRKTREEKEEEKKTSTKQIISNEPASGFRPIRYIISLILDGSLMQGGQQPYLDKGGHLLDMATTGCAKIGKMRTRKMENMKRTKKVIKQVNEYRGIFSN